MSYNQYTNLFGTTYDAFGKELPPLPMGSLDTKNLSYNYRTGQWDLDFSNSSEITCSSRPYTSRTEIGTFGMLFMFLSVPVIYCHCYPDFNPGFVQKLIFSLFYSLILKLSINGLIQKKLLKFIGELGFGVAVYYLFDKQVFPSVMESIEMVEEAIRDFLHIPWLLWVLLDNVMRMIFLFALFIIWTGTLEIKSKPMKMSETAHQILIQVCWMGCLTFVSCGLYTMIFPASAKIWVLVFLSIVIPICKHKTAKELASLVCWEEHIDTLPEDLRSLIRR
ncbi:MAG: hypothetical protein II943_06290 [Victivallales bacterium]|nr:hypothetical protein [Victivallales bacterium]